MSGQLPHDLRDWPADARFEYEERAALVQYLAREPLERAERLAEAMVRRRHAALPA